jgi:acyl transferase domain-containing protein
VALKPPTDRYVSTVSGDWITAEGATDPSFWTEQIRRPVRFADAVRKAHASAAGPIVEVGPAAGLAEQARRTLGGRPAFALLGRGRTEQAGALTTFGGLWSHDVPVELGEPTADGSAPRRVHLPGYHFAGSAYGALSLHPRPAQVSDPEPPLHTSPAHEPVTIAPRTADSIEERIAELLRSTLGVAEPEDREVSYLAAGGESLTAVHLGGRLREDFGLDIPVALLLEPIPLRALAKRIVTEGRPPEDGMLASLLGELEAESRANDAL